MNRLNSIQSNPQVLFASYQNHNRVTQIMHSTWSTLSLNVTTIMYAYTSRTDTCHFFSKLKCLFTTCVMPQSSTFITLQNTTNQVLEYCLQFCFFCKLFGVKLFIAIIYFQPLFKLKSISSDCFLITRHIYLSVIIDLLFYIQINNLFIIIFY